MSRRQTSFVLAVLLVGLALVTGCRKGGSFKLRELGFSMRLPPGWKQGEPRMAGGYRADRNGPFFFESAERDDPSGDVMGFPLEGDSLAEYVDRMLAEHEKLQALHVGLAKALDKVTGEPVSEELRQAQSRVISKRPCTVGGLEAIEVVTEAPRSTLMLYLRRGNQVVIVTFGAERQEFSKYEPLFRQAAATIRIR